MIHVNKEQKINSLISDIDIKRIISIVEDVENIVDCFNESKFPSVIDFTYEKCELPELLTKLALCTRYLIRTI